MKINILTLILLALLAACNTTPKNDKAPDAAGAKDETTVPSDRAMVDNPLGAIWEYGFNPDTEAYEIVQLRAVDKDTLTGEALEKIINHNWPKVQIRFAGTSNDTALVSIPDSEALARQMGSAGAENFMVSTTYSFTCMEGVNHVKFEFTEGDHAVPGVYHRNSWEVTVKQVDEQI
ncbi:MAG: hypothetical protein R6U64_00145 [Bacteroidales bacterium]